jgi:ankyrin repeat protein
MFDQLNSAFVKKFTEMPSDSLSYEGCIKPLLHHGFNFDVCDRLGIPLLCTVIASKSGDKYLDLLKAGVWVNIQDEQGNTPICYAAELGDREKIDTLLLYGAAVNKNIGTKIGATHPMRPLMVQLFRLQQCCTCAKHEDYLSNIPCVNRHLQPEVSFICKGCYDQMEEKKCPLCARFLGKFGI